MVETMNEGGRSRLTADMCQKGGVVETSQIIYNMSIELDSPEYSSMIYPHPLSLKLFYCKQGPLVKKGLFLFLSHISSKIHRISF